MQAATLKINKPGPVKATKPGPVKAKTARKALSALRRASIAVGGIGVSALGLSVIHCTQSISLLTGSHWTLAAMLAVTIDAGMVACEVAEITSHETKAFQVIRPWSTCYIVLAVILSMILNAIGSALQPEESMRIGSYILGAIIPVLVFILGRVAGHLWTAK